MSGFSISKRSSSFLQQEAEPWISEANISFIIFQFLSFFMYFGVSFSLLFYLSGERQDMSLSIYANLALVRCINCITV